MQPLVYAKGVNGVPTTTLVRDLSGRSAEVQFTHAALWGPLTASVRWSGTLNEGFEAADAWLGNELKVYSPDGDWLWEGIIWSVTFGAGRRQRTRSLEGYANRARVHYRTTDFSVFPPVDLGPGTSEAENTGTEHQQRYGVIEYQRSAGGMTATSAQNLANETLAERKHLLWMPETGQAGSAATIEIACYGWYRTLWYQRYVSATAGTAELRTVINTMLAAKAPHVVSSLTNLAVTGVLAPQVSDNSETPGELIKRLLPTAVGYTFGFDQNRQAYLRLDKREQTKSDYHEDLFGQITTLLGAAVPLWSVRPDAVLRHMDFVPATVNLSSAAIAAIENVYLTETTYSSRDNTLSYKSAVAGERGEVEA